jgi:hypothetical protein
MICSHGVTLRRRKAGVFHPKLYLALSEKRADGIVGSNNCTTGGIAYNMELCSAFTARAEHTDQDDLTAQKVARRPIPKPDQ